MMAAASAAHADYGVEAQRLMQQQKKGELGFHSAPVLKHEQRGTREDTIRRLSRTMGRVMAPSLGWSESFDPDEVQRLRKEPLRKIPPELEEDEVLQKSALRSDALVVREKPDVTNIERPGLFSIRVFGDGDAFRIVNEAASLETNHHVEMRLDEVEAERVGRRMIDDLDLVPADERKQLRFIKSRYVHFTGQARDPGERVVATEVQFGREIGGVPVIGPKGSRVVLEVSGDHVLSLSVDWGKVGARGKQLAQRPVGPKRLEARLRGHLAALRGRPAEDVTIRSKICGYLDPGARQGGEHLLQLGCQVEYGSDSAPQLAFIPLAENPQPQKEWSTAAQVIEMERAARDVPPKKRQEPAPAASDAADDAMSCAVGALGARTMGHVVPVLGGILLLLFGALRRRRAPTGRSRGRRWAAAGLAAGCGVLAASEASAEQGRFDYNAFMIKDYDGSGCSDFDSVQWENYNDFTDEMSDEGHCYRCMKNYHIGSYLAGDRRNVGWNADLVAVATHGAEKNSHGYLMDKSCNPIDVQNLEPLDGEMEIALLGACSAYNRDRETLWRYFRNLHRFGAPVSAGCYGTCNLSDYGYNTTWNEIGDELADGKSSVLGAWKDGYSVGYADDDIMVVGLGVVGKSDCDDKARHAGWHNRMSWEGPSYQHDRPFGTRSSDPELCGYWYSNW